MNAKRRLQLRETHRVGLPTSLSILRLGLDPLLSLPLYLNSLGAFGVALALD